MTSKFTRIEFENNVVVVVSKPKNGQRLRIKSNHPSYQKSIPKLSVKSLIQAEEHIIELLGLKVKRRLTH